MDPEFPTRDMDPAIPAAGMVWPPPVSEEPGNSTLAVAPPPVYVPPAPPVPGSVPRLLAGLESGILGAAAMIVWFAIDSYLEGQYWWAMVNLWGASVYSNRVFSMGLGTATLVGAAIHFFLHGLGGAIWSLIGAGISSQRLFRLYSFFAAAAWSYLLLHAFWPAVAPIVSRLTPITTMVPAYLLYGVALGRSAQRARQLGAFSGT